MKHVAIILQLKFAVVFLFFQYLLFWLLCVSFGITFNWGIDIIGFPIIACGFGVIGLGAAALAESDGVNPRLGEKIELISLSIRFLSKGPFQRVPSPHAMYVMIGYLTFFMIPYLLLWVLQIKGIGLIPKGMPSFRALYLSIESNHFGPILVVFFVPFFAVFITIIILSYTKSIRSEN